jgi:transcriptional antiterminator RfaH
MSMPSTPAPTSGELLRVPAEGRSWAVLHVRPRCEKKAARVCEQQDVPVYLPLRQKVHRYGGRERKFWSPLFPGYAFCVADAVQRGFLRQNRYVARVLDVHDQAQLVNQLRQIRRALEVGDVLDVMPYLEAGKTVRVTAGPLKGLEGIVARVKGRTRVIINVDMIQQSVAVEVESSFLAPG